MMVDDTGIEMTERSVLFASLTKPELREVLLTEADEAWFRNLEHQKLFRSMRELSNKGIAIDRASILRMARSVEKTDLFDVAIDPEWIQRGIVETGVMTLESLTESHIPVLRTAYQGRAMSDAIETARERILDQEVDQVGPWLMTEIERIMSPDRRISFVQESDLLQRILDSELESAEAERMLGPWTQIDCLDRLGFRLNPEEPVVLAGRPSEGKTTLGYQIALGASTQCGVAVFPLEDGPTSIANRRSITVSGESMGRHLARLAPPKSRQRLSEYVAKARNRNLYIVESRLEMRTYDIISSLQQLKRRDPTLAVAIIDQMYDIADYNEKGRNESDYNAVVRCVKRIINACKALQICPVMLQQLRKGFVGTPTIDDIADSDVYAKRARKVLLVSRPDMNADNTDTKALIRIAKWSNGPKKDLPVDYDGKNFNIDNFVDSIAASSYNPFANDPR